MPSTSFHCSAGYGLITLTELFGSQTVGEMRRLGEADGVGAVGRPLIALKVSNYSVKYKALVRHFFRFTTASFLPSSPLSVILLELRQTSFRDVKARRLVST